MRPPATRNRHPVRGGRPAPAASAPGGGRARAPPRRRQRGGAPRGRRSALTNLRKLSGPRWAHQGRPPPVLRRRLARAPAAPRGPGHGDEALPERRRRRVLLHEARARRRGPTGSRSARSSTRPGTSSTSRWSRTSPSLLWVVNLGCIDLNPWYARCDDVDRPGLPPFRPRSGRRRRGSSRSARPRCSCARRSTRSEMPPYAKTTGSRGIHVYVPIVRGPDAEGGLERSPRSSRSELGGAHPQLDHRRVPDREAADGPRARRLQPERLGPHARLDLLGPADAARRPVSTPVTWEEVEQRHSRSRTSASTTCPRASDEARRPLEAAAARRAGRVPAGEVLL